MTEKKDSGMTGRKHTKDEKGSRAIKEKEVIFYLILAAFVVLMLPHMIRFFQGNNSLIGAQPYYHARIAESIIMGDFGRDSMIYEERDYTLVPYHFILTGAGYILGVDIASKLLPFAFGIFSLVLFYLLLRQFAIGPFERFITSILLVISPPFIYLSTVSTPNSLSVFLSLLGLFFFLRKKTSFFILSLLCFAIASLSGLFNIALLALLLLFFKVIDEEHGAKAHLAILMMGIIYLVRPMGFYVGFEFEAPLLLKSFLSGLGAKIGFSIFSIILAVIGLFYSWKNKRKFYPLYTALAFIIFSSLYMGAEANLYANFLVVFFAALGLKKIRAVQWSFMSVRDLSFMVIACGLLFTTISYMDRFPGSYPSTSMADGLEWLKENSEENSLVISHTSRGFWIESIAQRPVLADSFVESIRNYKTKQQDINGIFYDVDLDDTMALLGKYGVKYILVDSEMRNGLVWSKEKEGLLYLFRNNKTFERVYAVNDTEIWRVYGLY